MTANVVTEAKPKTIASVALDMVRTDRAIKALEARRDGLKSQLIELGGLDTTHTTTNFVVRIGKDYEVRLDCAKLQAQYPEAYERAQLIKAQTLRLTAKDAKETIASDVVAEYCIEVPCTVKVTVTPKEVKE